MNTPALLHRCNNKLDAYYLKNVIQNVISIQVYLKKQDGAICLMVDEANQHKANVILSNKLSILPSVLAKKTLEEVVPEETSVTLAQSHDQSYLSLRFFLGQFKSLYTNHKS
ncbi:hypothetical protein [Ochrovirga pacifica]|uniref:hypothetical protein n=1 Tax=Ochrovirga pacifica TaxID=1042376 RepID=UPI0002559224|nr:hypothetical protein [Ochrovirga pacifica]